MDNFKKWLAVVHSIVVACILPFLVWVVTEIQAIRTWQAALEANRFTVKDGREVWQEIYNLREKFATSAPPAWFLEQFKSVSNKLDKVEERLISIERKVQ